jgi:outer membrane beta-barrel protein
MASTSRFAVVARALAWLLLGSIGAAPPVSAQEATELSLEEPGAGAAAGVAEPATSGTAGASTDDPDSGKTATDEGIDLTLQDRIKAVARKPFLKTLRLEVVPTAQVTINDAFIRTWTLGGRLAFHLNDAFALELGGGWVPPGFTQRLEPAELLKEKLALINIDNQLVGLADVGLTFSPLYGKIAMFGDGIVNFDGFVSAAVGATFDNGADRLHPSMTVGVGARVFLTRWLELRCDLRDTLYPQEKSQISTLQNLMFVGLGIGFYWPPDFEYQYEAARVNPNG